MPRKDFRKLALALPDAEEKSHFGKADFRVKNKIFAGFNDKGMAYVKLLPEQQEILCAAEPVHFHVLTLRKQYWKTIPSTFSQRQRGMTRRWR